MSGELEGGSKRTGAMHQRRELEQRIIIWAENSQTVGDSYRRLPRQFQRQFQQRFQRQLQRQVQTVTENLQTVTDLLGLAHEAEHKQGREGHSLHGAQERGPG